MAILIRKRLRHANDNTLLSLQIGHYRERLRINDHQTGKMASRAFKSDTPDSFEAGFGKKRGLNPRIAKTMVVPS